jgi:glycosyltransferase involved in cell wall biosynthesis
MGPVEKTRILYVHHRSELGGAPTSLSHLIRHLDRSRFEPHVYCPPGEAAELFRSAGAVVHTGPVAGFTHIWASEYRGRRWLLVARELGRLPAHLTRLGAVMNRVDFGLVHLNDSPLLPAAWLAHRHRVPVVWHLRSAPPNEGKDRRSRLLRRVILRLSDMTIAINSDVSELWDLYARIVPNSVDIDQFRPGDQAEARTALDLPKDRPIIACFGFLYPSKGFREFIRAAARLTQERVEATFLIVGGGVRSDEFFRRPFGRLLRVVGLAPDYAAEARRLVSDVGIEDQVQFIPFTRRPHELFRASDLVVAPSQGPEIGRPVLEGAASGVTVICTGSQTGGGILRPDETTLFLDSFEPETLADAIRDALVDEERRRTIGQAARRHAVKMFDPATNAELVERLYQRVGATGEKTRLLYVHHRGDLGGAPSSLAELIRNLDRDRYDPHVYVPDGPAAELFADAGATIHVAPVAVFTHTWDNPYSGLRWLILGREVARLIPHLRSLSALMKRYRFPIVHLNDAPLLPAAWVARRHDAKVVWHLRSALYGEGRDRRSRLVANCIDRWADVAIAIDEDVATRFPIRRPLSIVHNSVATVDHARAPDSRAVRRKLGLPHDRVIIGYAGFIRRPKGWPELLNAFRSLVDDGLPVHLAVIGGGVRGHDYFATLRGKALAATGIVSDEESAIAHLVHELRLDDHVSIIPFRPRMDDFYRALDVLAFPNQGVGLGRPVLEAAAYGKPAVASGSSGGAGLLVPGETGILVSSGVPAELVRALRRLVLDSDLRERLGRAAASHARQHFDARENARRIEDIYAWLLPPAESRLEPVAVKGRTSVTAT